MIGGLVGLALAQQWHVNAYVIGAAHRFFESYVFDGSLFLLNAAGVAQVHQLLNGGDILLVMKSRVVAKDVHFEPRTFLYHGQADAARADDRDGFSGDLVT